MSPFGLSVQSAMGRPRTTGTGKKPKRCTRIAVDYTHKRSLLEFLAAGYSVNEAIPHFYPNCSESDTLRKQKQISKWKKQQGHIVAVCDEGKGRLKNLRYSGQGTVLSSDAEGDIVLWINSMRKDGCPVSCQMLKYKAVEVAADEGLSLAIFKASHSWRFMHFAGIDKHLGSSPRSSSYGLLRDTALLYQRHKIPTSASTPSLSIVNQDRIGVAGGIPPLVALLSTDYGGEEEKEFAAKALRNCPKAM
ncbi:hypothetical protein ON010_g10291 [Phytophthora cinnamomi]|nr:hypothetical protein ON010_g10291 [Phytophthora cinnamomi]